MLDQLVKMNSRIQCPGPPLSAMDLKFTDSCVVHLHPECLGICIEYPPEEASAKVRDMRMGGITRRGEKKDSKP